MSLKKTAKYKKIYSYSRHPGGLDAYLIKVFGEKFAAYRDEWKKVVNRERVSEFPLFSIIETTSRCNFRCRFCFRSDPELREKITYPETLSMKLYQRIIDECAEHNCPSIALNNNNEPLLDKKIIQRLALAKKRGIMDVLLNTNALLLNEEMSLALIDSGLTRLMISLDAAGEKTYQQIRSSNYQKVIENIEIFLKIRSQKNSPLPILRLTFCVININEKEQDKFLAIWKNTADEISFQRYTPPLKKDTYLSLYPESRTEMTFRCSQPFERVIIKGNGNVYPCCYQSMNQEIGNIKSQSIFNIWHSDAFNEYRRIVMEEDWSKNRYCLECSQTR